MSKSVEELKVESDYLRGGIGATMADDSQDGFSEDDKNLIKFHGFYQQKIRDKSAAPVERHGSTFMIRGRIPGGRLSAAQYLEWDRLGSTFGNGGIRLTTRQTIQLHGVLKGELRPIMQAVSAMNLTTIGACGDVVRTVTQAVNPWGSSRLSQLDAPTDLLSKHFQFQSSAWAELWLNEERVSVEGDEVEPIYGKTYLPRKFKMAVTAVEHNGIDLYTNDFAVAATYSNDRIDGYFVFAGGGMGMTHNKPETFPRLADLLGWIPESQLIATAEAVVGVHRDFGDRTNRKHARLKYVIQEQGLAWFKAQVQERQGFAFDDRPLPAWKTPSYLGWISRADGTWALGVHILCGRIIDGPQGSLQTALRSIIEKFHLSIQLTADQDLILLGIAENQKAEIESILKGSGYEWTSRAPLYDRALACVSLPTCGLALAEAERVLGSVLEKIQHELEIRGLSARAPVLRMTGCPNGCARPYAAEIGIVGQMVGKYAIFLGGDPEGTRVARLWKQKIPLDSLAQELSPMFDRWKSEGGEGESFGAFAYRVIGAGEG